MPICEPLIILIPVLLFAVFVTHALSTTSEEGDHSTAGHCLIAVPVSLCLARGDSVAKAHLAVHPRTQRVPVFASITHDVSACDQDWWWVLVNWGTLIPLVRRRALTKANITNHWRLFLSDLRIIKLSLIHHTLIRTVLLRSNLIKQVLSFFFVHFSRQKSS